MIELSRSYLVRYMSATYSSPYPNPVNLRILCYRNASFEKAGNDKSLSWVVTLWAEQELRDFRVVVKYGRVVVHAGDACVESLPPGEMYELHGEIAVRDTASPSLKVELLAADNRVLAQTQEDLEWLQYNRCDSELRAPALLAALSLPDDVTTNQLVAMAKKTVDPAEQWPDYSENFEEFIHRLCLLWNVFASCKLESREPESAEIIAKSRANGWTPVLLFASCVSKMGYAPFLVLTPPYAYLGVKVCGSFFETTTAGVLRHKLPVFECVNVNGDIIPPRRHFTRSFGVGALPLSLQRDDFFFAFGASQLWKTAGINAVFAIPSALRNDDAEHDFDDTEILSTRPCTRMANWQLKLLDLSLRNPLLNVPRRGKTQLSLMLPNVAILEDKLSVGTVFRVKSLPDKFLTSAIQEKKNEADNRLLLEQCVNDMFSKRQLAVNMPDAQLEKQMLHLYNITRRELEESGANTLYIACGFLKWTRDSHKGKNYLAPLLLLPVRLSRASVKAGLELRGTDEESRMNLTLLEFLKIEYGLSIPELEGDLPTDEAGLDVKRIFNIVRDAISNMPEWEVVESCSLGAFSFTKYLMWKDLTDREAYLLRNPIVSQIAAEERSAFPVQVGFPNPAMLDNEVDADKVYTPMSSDSSQLSAVLAAARGKNFVLIGPPGTGKSQTITNMIAHCLGHGKTVLFVAEKAAALQVVHKRLKRIGLEDFCLEMHSNKANKKAVLAQYKSAVEAVSAGTAADSWEKSAFSLAKLRYKLNLLPWELHRKQSDETTLYHDVQMIGQFGHLPMFTPMADDMLTCTAERRSAMEDAARRLSRHYALLESVPAVCVRAICYADYSLTKEEQLTDAITQFSSVNDTVEQLYLQLMEQLCLDAESYRSRIHQLLPALQFVVSANGNDWSSLLPSQAKKTKRKLSSLKRQATLYHQLKTGLSLDYPESALDNPLLDSWLAETQRFYVSWCIPRFFGMMRMRKKLRLLAVSRETPDCLTDLTNLIAMREARKTASAVSGLPEHLAKGVDYGVSEENAVNAAVQALKIVPESEEPVLARLLQPDSVLQKNGSPTRDILASYTEKINEWQHCRKTVAGLLAAELSDIPDSADAVQDWCKILLDSRAHWRNITIWNSCREAAEAEGFGAMSSALMQGIVSAADMENATRVNFSRLRLRAAVETRDPLCHFNSVIHEGDIKDFAEQDQQLMQLASVHILQSLIKRASSISRYGTETAVLQREFAKQKAHMPLRKLMGAIPNITRLLKPCMLMSPLSVAQYLDASTELFDVVIFDEASQIPVWDAIGAIGRGRNAVIVGDPRQMPPTSFFNRSQQQEDDYVQEQDMESILDECLACDIPSLDLAWHYRSKAESLIAFSNVKYYDSKLTTFPAPMAQDCAVRYHFTAGVYEPGKGRRVNEQEAEALVKHVLAQLRTDGFRYTEDTSIGIVTFNAQQQMLIQEMLDSARAADESLEPYFSESNPEAIFVKNLENVQGDERGVIYFSTTYGPDARGVVSMNFGPLNISGGERRLNVAVTRARCALHVFTSLKPEDIDLNRTKAQGSADLRDFLDYARRGAASYLRLTQGGVVDSTDALAESIASALSGLGWQCSLNVGVSGYKVDLAILHPDREGELLAGVTLDGESYAAANTARDRDVLRHAVLTALGWRMLRVWSLDWWQDREHTLQKLHESLKCCLQLGPVQMPELPELVSTAVVQTVAPSEPALVTQPAPLPPLVGEPAQEYIPSTRIPSWSSLKDARIRELLKCIVDVEGPIKLDYLSKRVKTITGAADSLDAIQLRLEKVLHSRYSKGILVSTPEPNGVVVRLPAQPAVLPRARGNRDWTDVPDSELLAIADLVHAHLKCIAGTEEHLRGIATFLGVSRLTRTFKEYLTALLQNRTV